MNLNQIKLPESIDKQPDIMKQILVPIYKRRYEDMNYNITAVGMPGAGKSTALLKFMEILQVDPITKEQNLDPEKQVVFKTEEFLKLIQKTNPKTNPGYCVLFDEIEIEAYSKGWDSVSKALELAMSTMRFKRNVVCASLPSELQLLKGIRRLRDARLICYNINRVTNKINSRYHILRYNMVADTWQNDRFDATARYPKFRLDDISNANKVYKIKKLEINKPSRDIIRVYKKKKIAYLSEYYEQQINKLMETKVKGNDISFDKFCEFVDKYTSVYGKNVDLNPVLLSQETGLSQTKTKEFIRAYGLRKEIKKTRQTRYVD